MGDTRQAYVSERAANSMRGRRRVETPDAKRAMRNLCSNDVELEKVT
jgi:hypothetical protein